VYFFYAKCTLLALEGFERIVKMEIKMARGCKPRKKMDQLISYVCFEKLYMGEEMHGQ
jgi:UPF0716 family protein affecting phage T7 exclusion